jgi:hypothetical protein
MENEEMKNHFLELRAQGSSFSEIAGELNIDKPILLSWAKEIQDDVKERGCGCRMRKKYLMQ